MSAAPDPRPWRLCVAPMMERTDRHFRYLARLVSPGARLYTEMVTTGALLHGPRARLLAHDDSEQPLAVQLGGSDPAELAAAARLCAAAGFAEVNLNCGCPSDRVQAGAFGACLMTTPERVAAALASLLDVLGDASRVSIKLRLGVDDLYSYGYFRDFVARQAETGCRVFHVHARKAWLSGLSPRENREIPPLEYGWVHRLKRELPALVVVVNGGIRDIDGARAQLAAVDGVMIGRHAYDDPLDLAAFDAALCGSAGTCGDAATVLARYLPYVERELAAGTPLRALVRHLLNLLHGRPGARRWRRDLTLGMQRDGADAALLRAALTAIRAADGI